MQELERTSNGDTGEPVAPALRPEPVGRSVVLVQHRLRTDIHPRRRVTGLIGLLSLLLVLRLVSEAIPSTALAPDCRPENPWDERCAWFDSLLELAVRADHAVDAEPAWTDTRPMYADDLGRVTTIILNGLQDYGFVTPHRPKSVTFEDYGADASMIAGRYYESEDRVSLNDRYLSDPVWERRGFLKVLTHELIHAQGYRGEVQTETIAIQVVAALGNEGEPGFRRATLEEIRNDALWSAYAIAAHHAYFVADDNIRPACTTGLDEHGYTCAPVGPPNEAMLSRLDQVRQAVFDPQELRYSDYRVRWWEKREIGLLMSNYVIPPLAFTLQAYCGSPHELPSTAGWQPEVNGTHVIASLPADEADFLLADIGWHCPTWLPTSGTVADSSEAPTEVEAPQN